MANRTFLLHEDTDIFTSHGVLRLSVLYDTFNAGGLTDDFKLAGFYNGDEVASKVTNIKKFEQKEAYLLNMTATSMVSHSMLVYTNQIFVDSDGNKINIDDLATPGKVVIALNGMAEIQSASKVVGDYTFYAIEVDSTMPAVFGSKILLFSVEDGDQSNPFFIPKPIKKTKEAIYKTKGLVYNWIHNKMTTKKYTAKEVETLVLAPHFKAKEFACSHCGELIINSELVDKIEQLRMVMNAPIQVTSAYRCPTHNRCVGGSSSSFHIKGMALDIGMYNKFNGVEVFNEAVKIFPRVGLYQSNRAGFCYIHVDISDSNLYWLSRKVNGKNSYEYFKTPEMLTARMKNDYKIQWFKLLV